MKAPLLLSLLSFQSAASQDYCQTKVVTGAPSGSGLDGTYELKEDEKTKPEEACLDGCVYTRGGEEYCFRSEPLATSPDVVCESGSAGTGSPGTGPTGSPGTG